MYLGIDRKSFYKNPTNFSSTHERSCVKDATPLSKCRKIKSREKLVLKASHWSVMTSFLEDGGDEYIDDNDESDNSYDNTNDDDEDN